MELKCRIDKVDDFTERKEFWRKLGNMGLLGITASSQYGGRVAAS
jgi:isovaleryl-CoA dehydrogenase